MRYAYLQLSFWPSTDSTEYHWLYGRKHPVRRRAQRLASKWGGNWRDYLRGFV